MNSNLNKNRNIGDKKFFFNQAEKNDINDKNKNINIQFINSLKKEKNLAFSSDFKNNASQYMPKKRKRPEEEEEEKKPPKILNENEIYEVLNKNYKLLEHEIEEKEKKKKN